MSRSQKPFFTRRRNDSKTFLFSINRASPEGMPWQRRSFQDFPDALVQYLDQGLETDNAQRISMENVTVGNWVKKFVDYETSPRSGKNANKNKPYSLGTQQGFPEVPILSILSKVTPEASKILGCTL